MQSVDACTDLFLRHYRLLTVEQRDLLEDWELVLCDASVAFLPHSAPAFVVEHSDQLKLQNKKALVDIFESKDMQSFPM